MDNPNLHATWAKEQEFLNKLRATKPELFKKRVVAPNEIDEKIGITAYPKDLPMGYIRYLPQDFIVEEIGENGKISEIEPARAIAKNSETHTYYCELVKINVSTYDAIKYLAEDLGIDPLKIHHAGIKDQAAITSQNISITETNLKLPEITGERNYFLKNCREGKGAITGGGLLGNRFTIFVRTGQKVIEGRLKKRFELIKKEGVLNFYGAQRFGAPRFLSHELGKYILRGEFERAIKTFLVTATPYELPAIALLRKKAAEEYGNWNEIRRLFSNLPYLLRYELAILDYLAENPRHFTGALKVIREQSKFWIYAYNSYLFNLILSALAHKESTIPQALPTLMDSAPSSRNVYAPLLTSDKVAEFERSLDLFDIQQKAGEISTHMLPEFVKDPEVVDDGVVFCFTLPKVAYPAIVLSNFFRVYSGQPVPEWVTHKEYDIKKILGLGEVEKLKKVFASSMKPVEFEDQ